MTPKATLISVLSEFGYPVYLQGTFNSDEVYPETFITFWTSYTDDISHYDDTVHKIRWDFSVILYSADPEIVNTVPIEITSALKEAGFIPQGRGNDIPSDEVTHTGWAMEFILPETI